MVRQIYNGISMKDIKKYWDKQPCNSLHSTETINRMQYMDNVMTKRYFVEPHIYEFCEFPRWKDKRVLEVGCGMGIDGHQFALHGAEYYGWDISEESIKLTKERFELYDLKGDIRVQDIRTSCAYQAFDLVYSMGVLHHSPNIKKSIERIYEALNPGGELKIMLYAKNSWKYAMIKHGLDRFEAQLNCPYAKVYTKKKVRKLLKNFTDVKIKQTHNFMYKIPEYKEGKYELQPWFAAMPESIREVIKKELGWHLLISAKKRGKNVLQ